MVVHQQLDDHDFRRRSLIVTSWYMSEPMRDEDGAAYREHRKDLDKVRAVLNIGLKPTHTLATLKAFGTPPHKSPAPTTDGRVAAYFTTVYDPRLLVCSRTVC
ncbi:hypothetical protein RSOLAG22IIIB_01717 [Rhizoctonia solani]|uniref:Uncharacterized protein n=1 Tax=Rhizoctonia solani TaxID=456999 RepID=A0A0K6G8Z1_9AGAM|nr:hypothetical protein RSOLAG22IIIB_01717 [Rhizoctonia solani]